MNIKELVDQIVEDGKLTLEEHIQFIKAVNEDGVIDEEEYKQITRILEMIKNGELKVV